MSDTHIKGGAELQRFLDQLAPQIEKNIMRGAMRQGANVSKKEAQLQLTANGSVDTGLLKKGLKVSTNSKGGRVTAYLKVKGKHGYLARWIEYGVAAHGVKKGARRKSGKGQDGILHPGFNPQPFLRPALDNRVPEIVAAVANYVKNRLTKQGLDVSDIEIDEA